MVPGACLLFPGTTLRINGFTMQLKGSPFAWVCFAMTVGVMSTALISPLYPLYKDAWQLQASDVSLMYVLYMGGALAGLLFLGRLPDILGFRRVMLWALLLSLVGTFLTMVAQGMAVLLVGRIIVGMASSMMVTAASMGLGALAQGGSRQRVAMVTGMLISLGFGVGPLVGGIMAQWVPYPLVTAYLPPLLLGVLGWYALRTLVLPEHVRTMAVRTVPLRWQDCLPKLTWPQRSDSMVFILTCGMPFLGFGVFGMFASMAPLFLEKMVPWHGPMVSGSTIALILLMSATSQMLMVRMPTYQCGFWGMLLLVISNALLVVNLSAGSAILFGLGVIVTAAGHGMCMLSGMSMVNRIATPLNRSGLLSTYLVIGYIGSMAPMMGMGWIADYWGMGVAVIAFCVMVMVLGSALAFAFSRNPRIRSARD